MYNDSYGIAAIIILISTLLFLLLVKKNDKKDWISAICFSVVLLIGTTLYYFAIDFSNDKMVAFSSIFMLINSLGFSISSFFGKFNNQLYLSELAKDSQIFSIAAVIHFLSAVFLTSFTVIRLLGKKLINKIRIYWISLWEKYIVIGCEGKAIIFLKNLNQKQKQRTIVILQSSQENIRNELINKGYAVVSVKEEKEIEAEKNDKINNIKYTAFANALKKAGAMNYKFKTRIISMSEQDEINLLIAKIMTDYIEINKKELNKMKLDIRIMYSFLESSKHFTFIEKSSGKLTFFNPYKLNAQKFCMENPITTLIPNIWIDTEKAKLKINKNSKNSRYKINTIFVGFGSVNNEMLKKNIINNQLLNVDYNALVLCKNAVLEEKMFKKRAIGLFDEIDSDNNVIKSGAEIKPNPGGSVYLENPIERNIIKFKEADALTIELYDYIIRDIEGKPLDNEKSLNVPCDYTTIMIALGDDRLNIETALELRQKLYEADLLTIKNDKTEYQSVKIFVKIKENNVYTDKALLNHDAEIIKCEIITYGTDEEILTEEFVINEKLDILAKNIANGYEGKKEDMYNKWGNLPQHKRESNRYAAMSIRVKLNLLGFDLINNKKSETDYSELYRTRYGIDKAIELRTKRIEIEKRIENDKKNKSITEEILNLKIDDEIIDLAERDNNDFADTARNNLAKLEHQRWNTFHLANDWTKFPIKKITSGSEGRQDGIAKQHACITTFHGLIVLMELQKEEDKKKKEQYIETDSLLNNDTIRYDFSTMDFLLDLSEDNKNKLREAGKDQSKQYTGILTDSGYSIDIVKSEPVDLCVR